ncbi:GumC family protein [Flavobacterium sp. S87F.05.LMB.W.Kidney.N]|uniref:GumC family protein n=1 Tax=Flavobacterium sp. S87F.05.LMB.W.Kidney.N TaxID=1278758 RepID=UPI00106562B0|nr:tyrosine-protein kinase family protein [Flavobacterium sp. S87F.05.LMB.W.Kidney.N]TDX12238.1 capsular exopolysaccharide synthesis family protein [Flavobacterium sp. S87F.05.LMB.W.Kidney.N]
MQKRDYYNDFIDDEIEDDNFREQLDKYLVHWHWFLFSIIIGLVGAFTYLCYATRTYEAHTTVLVKDEKKGGILSELSAFSDIGLGGSMKSNVDNEIEILKSRSLIEKTIKKLNLNISLFAERNIVDQDIYQDAPIRVNFINRTELFDDTKIILKCNLLSSGTFSLKNEIENEANVNFILASKKEFKYGEKIPTKIGTLIIDKAQLSDNNKTDKFESISIQIKPFDEVAEDFKKRLKIDPISKTSSIVEVSITDPVANRAEAFLDNLIQIYNEDAAEDKNLISENTSQFISNRLSLITKELDGVEQNVEGFKKTNRLTDINSEAKLFIEGSNEYDKKGVETEIQLNVISSLLGFMKNSTNSDLLPSNIITDKGDAGGLISAYNQLVLDRNRILKSATTDNPSVIKLDQQINSLKSSVTASLNRIQSNLEIQNKNIRNQEGILNNKIAKIPVQERQLRGIARQQKVKEELYLYLLQKREETAISLAATEPNARVIDSAKAEQTPVNPKKKIIYLAVVLLGLLVPFVIIYANDLLDTKIKNSNDLEGKTQIPFIGEIPSCNDISELIKSNSRSSSAEALRIVRTNLGFMLNKVEEGKAKTIFVTSTFASEGKTFVSTNLAASFALLEKRVLLMGMDIRSPRLNEYMDLPAEGVTNYLSSNDHNVDQYIVKHTGYENFYILPAGVVPPNPAELLMDNKKVDQLFEKLKKEYDYIIVDTAPSSLVTDTLLVAKNADTFVYIMRARFLEKRMISIANGFFRDKKLPNMCIVLNDTNPQQKYGYGYVEKSSKAGWFKKLIG